MDYPERPRFFAFKFCRLLARVCAANEIGPETCWMLAVIVQCEDAKQYRAPVTYFNDQLLPLVGVGSVDALDRIRRKAIAAGWLNYQPGRKGVAGTYYVTIPPHFCGINDKVFDEDPLEYHPQKCGGKPEESRRKVRRKAGGKCGDNPRESAEHSTLSLTLALDQKESSEGCASEPSASALEVFGFPCKGNPCWWSLTEAQIGFWRSLFPGHDIEASCRAALAWVDANPAKRKTAGGMKRFLTGWISRDNDRGSGNGNGRTARPTKPMILGLPVTDGSDKHDERAI